MNNDKLQHLWIPDGEVEIIPHKPTGREKRLNLNHKTHGSKLISDLTIIEEHHLNQENPVSSELVVLMLTLQEQQKMDNKERQKILAENGLQLNAVKDRRTAIVSTSPEQLKRVKSRVQKYQEKQQYYQYEYIDSFSLVPAELKQAEEIKEVINKKPEQKMVDIQILMVPNFTPSIYERAGHYIESKIKELNGEHIKTYSLSDGTPVIRGALPVSAITDISKDDFVLRIEETSFFYPHLFEHSPFSISGIKIDNSVDLSELPSVAVLDTGISFPSVFSDLISGRLELEGVIPQDTSHGTAVASRVIFGDSIDYQVSEGILKPRTKVIDVCISDGKPLAIDIFIQRIQTSVYHLHDKVKIFNLSFNTNKTNDTSSISIAGYEIDNLIQKYKVQFVIATGNHDIWLYHNNIDDVLDDDDTQLGSPADSFLSIAVGSITRENDQRCITQKNQISVFSRRGPGFAGNLKPDLVAPGGNVYFHNGTKIVPREPAAYFITKDGNLSSGYGTSYACPVVSGDLAEVALILPVDDILLASALLIHTAQPLWDIESIINPEEKEYVSNIFGKGLSNPKRALNSTSSSVTFVRYGFMDRLTKHRVKFWMPTILSAQPGKRTARVTVTCMSRPPLDRSKGTEYLGAYVGASLKKVRGNELAVVNPKGKEGREEWQPVQHFQQLFSKFDPGDWQIWLQLHTRWGVPDDLQIPYALVVTVDDPSDSLDIYSVIEQEVGARFRPINTIRVEVGLQGNN